MKKCQLVSFCKFHAAFFSLIVFLIFPAILFAQMKTPVQQLPSAVQAPQKAIKIDKQQAQEVFYLGVKVEAVQLWPPDACGGTWQARISNPQDVAIGKSLAIPYQFNIAENQWIEGPIVEFNLDKNQNVTVQGQWDQILFSTQLKIAFKPEHANKTYDEKIISFPARGNPNLSIEQFEVGDKFVGVHIKNNSQVAGCNLTVQKYTAKNSDPENFTPAGGRGCNFPGNSTTSCRSYVDVAKWKQGWDMVKIVVFGDNNLVLAQRILPIP